MPSAPQPILNDGYFQVGQDIFPITSSITNSTLQDGDKVLFYLLDFNQAILNRYLGDRFAATCAQFGISASNFSGTVVGSTLPMNPVPYLADSGLNYPLLAIWRGAGTLLEKDISTHKWQTTLNILYIIPPLKLSHIEQISPLIGDVLKVLSQKNEYGHDLSYNDGYSIAPLAGYSALGVKTYDRLQINIPGQSSNLPFEAVHLEMWVEEINVAVTPSIYPTVQSINIDVQLDADPPLDHFIDIQEPV